MKKLFAASTVPENWGYPLPTIACKWIKIGQIILITVLINNFNIKKRAMAAKKP